MSLFRSALITLVALIVLVLLATAASLPAQSSATLPLPDAPGFSAPAENPRYFRVNLSDAPTSAGKDPFAPQRTTTLFPTVRARARYASPEAVAEQLPLVAAARGVDQALIVQLVQRYTERTPLGPFSHPGVNIPMLNLALDALQ